MTGSEFAKNKGYHVIYREHDRNICPGCGRSHWIIGRSSAECAFCHTTMDLDFSRRTGVHAREGIYCRGNGHEKIVPSIKRKRT